MQFAFYGPIISINPMKIGFISLVIALSASLLFSQANISLGDDLKSALERLGKPVGTIELRDKTLLLYPQGEVEIRDDRVIHFDLMTAREFAAEQEKMLQEQKEWAAEQERRAAAHKKEGLSIKKDKQSSAAFAALPAKDRVDFWRNFQIKYPGVDVAEELARALEGYEVELAELKTQQRIAELETRVARAEKEAAQARLETEKLRQSTAIQRQSTGYGLRYYYDGPTYRPRHHYRTPTVTIFTNQNGTKVIRRDNNRFKHRAHNSTTEKVVRQFGEGNNP